MEDKPTMKELKEIRKEDRTVWTVQLANECPGDCEYNDAVFDDYKKAWKYYKYLKKFYGLGPYDEEIFEWREVKDRKRTIPSQAIAKSLYKSDRYDEDYHIRVQFSEQRMNRIPYHGDWDDGGERAVNYSLYHK